MLQQSQLRVTPDVAGNPLKLKAAFSTSCGIDANRIKQIDILRRSIDARQKRVMINLNAILHIDEIDKDYKRYTPRVYNNVHNSDHVIIVGAGPAGLFAALELIEAGIKPIILERGKDVDSRRRDMAAISREGIVNPDSNYCFGEGGAGAFSDGKLYTRSTKRGPVDKVLQTLHAHGASDNILIDSHPHIGSDRLPEIIKAIRNTIISCGGEIHFNSRVTNIILSEDKSKAIGVITADGKEYHGPVILATGHSARDVYQFLYDSGIELQPKGIAVGVRLEHPQELIDKIQYHSPAGRGKWLPPAEYSMLTRIDGRAVYSFCMCPGGVIIPAASHPGQLVVNGMSSSSRGSRWANSGMVVEIYPEDIPEYDKYGPLKMMKFQQDIEQRFFDAAGHTQKAPAQRMTDFVNRRKSDTLPSSSYPPGIISERIDNLLPEFISHRLREAFKEFGRKSKGFLSEDACLVGDETRTSSPVRIPRKDDTRSHLHIDGLFPVGEGAGYAGGIVSAAIDGINTAEAIRTTFFQKNSPKNLHE